MYASIHTKYIYIYVKCVCTLYKYIHTHKHMHETLIRMEGNVPEQQHVKYMLAAKLREDYLFDQ